MWGLVSYLHSSDEHNHGAGTEIHEEHHGEDKDHAHKDEHHDKEDHAK
jgi:hypothetical protein